jgi:hypothetical protein
METSAARLLHDLEALRIELYVEGDHLRLRSPRGVMSQALADRIGKHKAELHKHLSEAQRLSAAAMIADIDDTFPLTPAQAWYSETFEPETHAWALTLAFDVLATSVSAEMLTCTAELLTDRYDVFQIRMQQLRNGRWVLRMRTTNTIAPLTTIDVSAETGEQRTRAVADAAFYLQAKLNIVHGPVLAMTLCKGGGPSGGDRVLVSLHHHTFDGYSMQLIVADLVRIYSALAAEGKPPTLAPVGSYKYFLHAMHQRTHEPAFVAQALAFWHNPDRLRPVAPIPVDIAGGQHTDKNSHDVLAIFDAPFLRALLRVVARRDASLSDALILALMHAYARWSGERRLRIDFEHHARGGFLPNVDLLDTVGPTTIKVPILLEANFAGAIEDAFTEICHIVRETIENALGYGFLRYTCDDAAIRQDMASCPPAQVFFNNRWTLSSAGGKRAIVSPPGNVSIFPVPSERENIVSYDLMVNCEKLGDALRVSFTHSTAIHRVETIRRLAQDFTAALRTLVDAIDS